MQRLRWFIVSLGLGLPHSGAAQAQPINIVGNWRGVDVRDWVWPRRTLADTTAAIALWPDSLFLCDGACHAAGRWRLHGDTLWLGDDWRYGHGFLFDRFGKPFENPTDTLPAEQEPYYPRNDSLFWTVKGAREFRMPDGTGPTGCCTTRKVPHRIDAYKVLLTNEQLTLIRLDDLSEGYDNAIPGTNGLMIRGSFQRTTIPIGSSMPRDP